MPLTLWRLVKARHAATAFDGEGARRHGGRWNSHGLPAVYLGGSLALAALETFVHLAPEDSRLNFAAIPVEVPDNLAIDTLDATHLPKNWREEPPPPATQALGGQWLRERRGALLRLPSVIVPEESIYLVNPLHPDARRLVIGPARAFGFDHRMWK